MPTTRAVLVVLATLTAASPALAGGPPGLSPAAPVAETPAPATTRSYAGELAKADLLGVALILGGGAHETLAGFGAATLVLGAPIQHARRGHYDRAVGSLAARVGLPLVGLVAGMKLGPPDLSAQTADCDVGRCGGGGGGGDVSVIGALLGFVAGGVAAVVIDYKVLARERVATPAARGAWSPTLAVAGDGGVSVGLAGGF